MLKYLFSFWLAFSQLFAISLTWDPNSEPDLAGYRIYSGTASANYSRIDDVGLNTSTVLNGLVPGTQYYIAATAYDMGGLESALSNEVIATQALTTPRIKLCVVVEMAIFPQLFDFNAWKNAVTADGVDVEVVQYDSRGPGNSVNVSSFKARQLAENVFWPRIASGTTHFFCIGELPVGVMGLNQCPDGHRLTFTPDGWRDGQNTAGAYRSPHFYAAPGPFDASCYADTALAALSLNTQKMNGVGDGRVVLDVFPSNFKPRAAVGWLGGFGPTGTDPNGLVTRGAILNDYLKRNVAYRTGGWQSSGAAYEFAANAPQSQADGSVLNKMIAMYGSANVVSNARAVLIGGAQIQNRPVAFKIFYTGSDWLGNLTKNLQRPVTVLQILQFSYAKEIPGWNPNWLVRGIIDSRTQGPLVVIPWEQSLGLDLSLFNQGKTVGQVAMDAFSKHVVLPYWGFYGDPTLRLSPP